MLLLLLCTAIKALNNAAHVKCERECACVCECDGEAAKRAYPGGTPSPAPAPAPSHSPISPLFASFRLTLSEGATLAGEGAEGEEVEEEQGKQ